jgi:serpin B
MTVLLPRPEIGLDSLCEQFTAGNWDKWTSSLAKSPGELFLPKFKLEYELTLNDALTSLGMGVAFDQGMADFTKINKERKLYISEVKHKTFVDVNEEGTEAAAVTSVGMMLASAQPVGFVMRVDRPFLFVIRDHHSGAILFMGKIIEPTL